MKVESRGAFFWRLARTVLIIDSIISIIVALVCWFSGWRTIHYFGVGLIIGGFVALAIGAAIVFGGVNVASDPTHGYIQSVSSKPLDERTQQNRLDLNESWVFLSLMIAVGILIILVGWLITILI